MLLMASTADELPDAAVETGASKKGLPVIARSQGRLLLGPPLIRGG
jgi:hypothetical protein